MTEDRTDAPAKPVTFRQRQRRIHGPGPDGGATRGRRADGPPVAAQLAALWAFVAAARAAGGALPAETEAMLRRAEPTK